MGILNLTPDSFSDGGTLPDVSAALRRAAQHVGAGAAVLDLGAESTRPGAVPVPPDVQCRRIVPVVEAIVREAWPVALSIDTQAHAVAQAAIAAGAHLINDISGLRDPRMAQLVARTGCYAIVMHMRGTPATMHLPVHHRYTHVVDDVRDALQAQLTAAQAYGIQPDRLWVDPGIGFAKNATHNWQLTKHLGALLTLGRPVVYAASRKAFLGAATGRPVHARDAATAAVCAAAVAAGAQLVRVHDVAAVADAVAVGWALRQAP
jgi:dihydropteroate synthase